MEQLCRTCAYRSDGINARSQDYCYCLDKEIDRSGLGCAEWRGSLRAEPLNDLPGFIMEPGEITQEAYDKLGEYKTPSSVKIIKGMGKEDEL